MTQITKFFQFIAILTPIALALAFLSDTSALATGGSAKTNAQHRTYYTPLKGSAERKQIMNAARVPVSRDIGQRVIFVVDILRSDGNNVYLQAVPHQPNGKKLDWAKTNFRDDWLNDAMSDSIMVLLVSTGDGWTVRDYIIGPTDVAWYDWIERYGLPESLFNPDFR